MQRGGLNRSTGFGPADRSSVRYPPLSTAAALTRPGASQHVSLSRLSGSGALIRRFTNLNVNTRVAVFSLVAKRSRTFFEIVHSGNSPLAVCVTGHSREGPTGLYTVTRNDIRF
jgi:hypothetical protein